MKLKSYHSDNLQDYFFASKYEVKPLSKNQYLVTLKDCNIETPQTIEVKILLTSKSERDHFNSFGFIHIASATLDLLRKHKISKFINILN